LQVPQGSSDNSLNRPISIKSFQLHLLFAMPIALLIKILRLIIMAKKRFLLPLSTAMQGLLSQESQA
tara:strand:+ start:323 stop:523 length:201 start_codon:yes stop_codon:yes gene_type:complete